MRRAVWVYILQQLYSQHSPKGRLLWSKNLTFIVPYDPSRTSNLLFAIPRDTNVAFDPIPSRGSPHTIFSFLLGRHVLQCWVQTFSINTSLNCSSLRFLSSTMEPNCVQFLENKTLLATGASGFLANGNSLFSILRSSCMQEINRVNIGATLFIIIPLV